MKTQKTKSSLRKLSTAVALTAALANVEVTQADDTPAFMPNPETTALLITDPQNDFMSESGAAWGLVKDNVTRLGTNENIASLMKAAKSADMQLFVSPHSYYEHDKHWHERGPVQGLMNKIDMFRVDGPTTYANFKDSGADFYPPLKQYIEDGKTVITSPHKVYGPDSNDLVLQLRKRGIQTVLLGGFAANLCTDSHMRELTEQGFNVVVVKDAVGAPSEEAYQAALTNYNMIANAVWDTQQAVSFID